MELSSLPSQLLPRRGDTVVASLKSSLAPIGAPPDIDDASGYSTSRWSGSHRGHCTDDEYAIDIKSVSTSVENVNSVMLSGCLYKGEKWYQRTRINLPK
ncbi:hypothetical protein BHM03_00013460 [Ensete ventricosum]|nr:hypothetical protein BHM03_00013460 [Ensete ventricosum]